jgi:crotonobetainyl-CoA:carnitine CoA-transferase CaiB-like acyl-CoA transferase
LVAAHLVTKTTGEWEEIFGRLGMWCARVRSYAEVEADPQVAFNETIVEYDDPVAGKVRLLSHPVRYDGKAPEMTRRPPALGEHTIEVLAELGYGNDHIEALQRNGAVGPARARP